MGQEHTSLCLFSFHPSSSTPNTTPGTLLPPVWNSCGAVHTNAPHHHHRSPTPSPSFLSDGFAPPVLRCAGLERSKEAEREEWIWWTEERGTMAALSALLKTWVILQTLCLALAQVVSEQGKMRPVLFWSSVGIKAPGKVWRAVDVKR